MLDKLDAQVDVWHLTDRNAYRSTFAVLPRWDRQKTSTEIDLPYFLPTKELPISLYPFWRQQQWTEG